MNARRATLASLLLVVAGTAAAAPVGQTPLPPPTSPPGAAPAATPPGAAPAATPAPMPAPTTKAYDPQLVQRGEYLVRLGGCADCHTPVKLDPALGMPVPDLARSLSGHPAGGPDPTAKYAQPDIGVIGPTFTSFAVPFGIVYSANITSDPTTGIGAWTEQSFIRSMRTGKRGGVGRPILPPMPWFNLVGATDDDLRAMFAYLQSTPPIRNAVPRPAVTPEAMQQIAAAYEKMLAAAPRPGAPSAEPLPARR